MLPEFRGASNLWVTYAETREDLATLNAAWKRVLKRASAYPKFRSLLDEQGKAVAWSPPDVTLYCKNEDVEDLVSRFQTYLDGRDPCRVMSSVIGSELNAEVFIKFAHMPYECSAGCRHEHHGLRRYEACNGTFQVRDECYACGDNMRGKGINIPHAQVKDIFESIPIVATLHSEPCVVCAVPKTELHHWAPRHLFGDECEKWPTSYLCIPCHTRWHKIVTPEMWKPAA